MHQKYLSGVACLLGGASFAVNSLTLATQHRALGLVVAICGVVAAAIGGYFIGRNVREPAQSVPGESNT